MGTLILISANAEWQAIRDLYPLAKPGKTPYGEWFDVSLPRAPEPVIFFQGGWGKIAAAASTQYAVDRWKPELVINLGTCGGMEGKVSEGQVILAERTLVYDIIEQMSDPDEAIAHYTTQVDLSWLGDELPAGVQRALLVSADRDLVAAELPMLAERYDAVAGDWESGAIAWVCARNGARCLILRGVSDVVSASGDVAYGNYAHFVESTQAVMRKLVESLPGWIIKSKRGIQA